MPEEKPTAESVERLTVDIESLKQLRPEVVARLRDEFGLSVELSSSKPGLSALLDSLRRGVPGVGDVAAYDRGFDRTNPGYDKYYDRDRAALTAGQEVINPALDVSVLNQIERPR